MTAIFGALQGVLTILVMVSGGYILSVQGWFSEETVAAISRLVIRVAIPALMLTNVTAAFDREAVLGLGPGVLVPLGTILFAYGLAVLLGRLLGVPRGRRGLFQANFAFSNTIFVGVPVNIALFGEEAVPFVTLYYLINTTLFWTLGVHFLRRDGGAEKAPALSFAALKQIFSPVVVCFIVAVALVLLEIRLPSFLMSALKYTAAMTTPLSMIIIGITIHSVGFAGMRVDRELLAVMAGRFLIAPAAAFFLLGRIPAPDLMRKVFLITASMPVMTQIALVARAYGADHRNAGVTATVTTAASLVVIPIIMLLFGA